MRARCVEDLENFISKLLGGEEGRGFTNCFKGEVLAKSLDSLVEILDDHGMFQSSKSPGRDCIDGRLLIVVVLIRSGHCPDDES